jgi:two-component system, cell cycle response regulator CtrA
MFEPCRILVHVPEPAEPPNWLNPVWDAFAIEPFTHGQEFTSGLFRDGEACGLMSVADPWPVPRIIRDMRRANVLNPLLVLVDEARRSAEERIRHRHAILMAGADDVQAASIDDREIAARLRALARRGSYVDHLTIRVPGAVYRDALGAFETDEGRVVHLSPAQAKVFSELARRPRETRSKDQIMDALYGGEDEAEMKIIDVLICKLRQRIADATGGMDVIATIWGRGYQFVPEGCRPQLHVTRFRRPS